MVSGMRSSGRAGGAGDARDASDTRCHRQDRPLGAGCARGAGGARMCAVTETTVAPRAETRARIEQAALGRFLRDGFEPVTIDDVAEAAGIGRRTFFRYFATKADAVWGDFDAHVARLDRLL